MFPGAQVIITEIHDPELGVDVDGPVGRLLDAGAHADLPPRPLKQVAENVQANLASATRGVLEAAPFARHQLPMPGRAVNGR